MIELDGGQHYTEDGKAKDMRRDEFMRSIRLRVLRFSDRDVFDNMDKEGALQESRKNLKKEG
ncbi:MAG: DUF559 domain-containing protein [Nitrospirae bacterium]|nr:DUF559 domain-containing protein [Nitrospirota bacterium]